MTSTVQRYQPPASGARTAVSQATSIEQSRAIADVQAAVTVAQSCPRDMADAEREMEYVCGRLDVAEQAFYAVQNRGTGPSVHLMRELARIWGNVDYGVKELSRSDDKGESEVLATCWDMQKNTRSSRTFIVPHQRMVKVNGVQQRKDLFDLQDVYLNNQNIGARAVRECIETILPRWFTQKAQDICHQTLANGEGEPLQDRINRMVEWFRDSLGVSQQQLEARIGKKRGAWSPEDVAQMKIAGKSIAAGEVGRDEVFPAVDAEIVTDLCAEEGEAAADAKPLTDKVKKAAPKKAAPHQEAPDDQHSVPETGDVQGDQAAEPPAEQEPVGAPSESTPGQTDRVAAALNQARKGGARQAMADTIDAVLAKVKVTDPDDIRAVASHILKVDIADGNNLDLKQIKTVHDTLIAWRDVGTLERMVTDAINTADARTAEQAEDGDIA